MDDVNPYLDEKSDQQAAKEMDEITKTVFAPIYPVIAYQINKKFNIKSGNCIDIGSGPASLSISLALITNLQIFALDISTHSFKIAEKNIKDQGLSNRLKPVKGRVEKMPFEDNFADLIVSRGSVFFWEDLVKAFNEIYRVLKPGGKTYIGGGFGSVEMKEKILNEMAKRDRNFSCRLNPGNKRRILDAIQQSTIQEFNISEGDEGFWVHITKENDHEM